MRIELRTPEGTLVAATNSKRIRYTIVEMAERRAEEITRKSSGGRTWISVIRSLTQDQYDVEVGVQKPDCQPEVLEKLIGKAVRT